MRPKANSIALEGKTDRRWQRAARSRLRMELTGLAFAVKHGFSPEEYARHVWGQGAVLWMGKEYPTPREYLEAETKRLKVLFPWVDFQLEEYEDGFVELLLANGCLGSWTNDRFTLAHHLGLTRQEVCRYCQEAFRVWSLQLGLEALPLPGAENSCSVAAIPLGDTEGTEHENP